MVDEEEQHARQAATTRRADGAVARSRELPTTHVDLGLPSRVAAPGSPKRPGS